jgi:hypothetical protein
MLSVLKQVALGYLSVFSAVRRISKIIVDFLLIEMIYPPQSLEDEVHCMSRPWYGGFCSLR